MLFWKISDDALNEFQTNFHNFAFYLKRIIFEIRKVKNEQQYRWYKIYLTANSSKNYCLILLHLNNMEI